ncbi:sialate O-acetylesterase [Lacipirellula parvula]|uniref:Sialic acid-specific 9-O-acetylesterase n=1 Tax=Lacipirellula parvula TaxID=2650471 RepID=A0A5K7XD90_9BACT|nr:sialate O-acetylesterase [Lacipirellula parvula]BBO34754.1 sialic acid-specific 9-O-acetylesterase [Lacipirellula parvula]
MNVAARAFVSALVALAISATSSQSFAQATTETATAKKLSLASIFSDHMVLQRDIKLPIWGAAAPGAKVEVKLAGQTKEATADKDGKWTVSFTPLKAGGGPLELSVASDGETAHMTDILVGDVWVASGQSNMEWPIRASKDAESEAAAADWPEIRFVDVPNVTSAKPLDSFKSAGWQPVKPENITEFSAVAYYFARDLHKELNVPIGLIGCNWGGTQMEAWVSREALESSDTFKPAVAAADQEPTTEEVKKHRQERPQDQPASLFNGMLSSVIPYGIRGAIWYQGESNAGRHGEYAELSKLMIADWRNRWGQGEFPFLLVQLAAFEPGGDSWPPLREAQVETLESPNTGMAVTTDIGDRKDIHPRNKQDVGKRLALAARKVAYGEDLVYSGPMFKELKVTDGKAHVTFAEIGGGLKADGALKGFEVAGDDGKFVPANAVIEGAEVVVSADGVNEPKVVRYNWAAFPEGNLFNAEGLPASPFRSKK